MVALGCGAGTQAGGRGGATGQGGAGGDAAGIAGKAGGGGAAGVAPTGSGGSTGGAGGAVGTAGVTGAAGAASGFAPPLCTIALSCSAAIVDRSKITCELTVVDGFGGAVYAGAAGVELRGRSSLAYPKKNYAVELRTADGLSNPVPMLGMGKESDFVLDGCWADRSLMRNALIYDSFSAFGRGDWAPEGRYCTLALDGQPQGIYRMIEKIKRDDDRVNISADDGTGASFVLKQDRDGTLMLSIGLENHWQLVYPDELAATAAQRAAVQGWLDRLGAALRSADPGDAQAGVPSLLDLDALADWMLAQELSKNIDGFNLSLYFSRDAGGLARVIPWDFDLAFGQPTVRNDTADPKNDSPEGWITHRPAFVQSLIKISALTSRLGPRWRELRAGALASPAIASRLDMYQLTLTPAAIADNFARWPLADVDFTAIYRPYSFYPVASYVDEVGKLRAFITARLAWIDAHVDAYAPSP